HRDLLQRGAPARGRRHGEALEAQRALEGLPDGRLVVDDEDQRLRGDEPHAAAYPWRCPNPKAKPPRTSGRASLTFWTSMFSFCASSVANWSRACVATFWNAASSCAVVTPRAVASFWRMSSRAAPRSRWSPAFGRRLCRAERTLTASTPVADAMSFTTVFSNAPRSKRRPPLRSGRSLPRSWRALSRPAWTFVWSTPRALASAAAKSPRWSPALPGPRSGSTELTALVTWSTGLPSAAANAWIASVLRWSGVFSSRMAFRACCSAVVLTPSFCARSSNPNRNRSPRTPRPGPLLVETFDAPAAV